jgi:uncharacterized protein (UPF0147 family)
MHTVIPNPVDAQINSFLKRKLAEHDLQSASVDEVLEELSPDPSRGIFTNFRERLNHTSHLKSFGYTAAR